MTFDGGSYAAEVTENPKIYLHVLHVDSTPQLGGEPVGISQRCLVLEK